MFCYRLLLVLYPRAFRAEYGDEILRTFGERHREAVTAPARVATWLSLAADTVVSAAAAHADLLRQDLRTSLRTFARTPGFAAAVVLVAALGIGATATAFVITDHVLVRPLPFPHADRLVKIYQDQSFRGYSRMELSPPNFLDYQRDSRSFEGMAAYTPWSSNLLGAGEPARVEGANVTGGLFAMLGAQPAMGRTLTTADDRLDAPRTVVISHSLWQTQFAGRADILGQSVLLDDEPLTIVGVMPASFTFPYRETDFWFPFRFNGGPADDRTNWYLNVVARLRDDVSIQQARTEMSGLATNLAQAYPDANAKNGATVIGLRDEVTRQARLTLLALAGASLRMLLIACTNLASLLLSRTLDRHRELSVRTALGAGRDRLVRQIVESDFAARVVQVRVLGAFAATAVLLAAVGLHGLLSFSVAARTREIGVRLALRHPAPRRRPRDDAGSRGDCGGGGRRRVGSLRAAGAAVWRGPGQPARVRHRRRRVPSARRGRDAAARTAGDASGSAGGDSD